MKSNSRALKLANSNLNADRGCWSAYPYIVPKNKYSISSFNHFWIIFLSNTNTFYIRFSYFKNELMRMRTNRKVKSHRRPSFCPEQLRSPCAPCRALKYLFILHIYLKVYIYREREKETMNEQVYYIQRNNECPTVKYASIIIWSST